MSMAWRNIEATILGSGATFNIRGIVWQPFNVAGGSRQWRQLSRNVISQANEQYWP